jgi:hypothetical protein
MLSGPRLNTQAGGILNLAIGTLCAEGGETDVGTEQLGPV